MAFRLSTWFSSGKRQSNAMQSASLASSASSSAASCASPVSTPGGRFERSKENRRATWGGAGLSARSRMRLRLQWTQAQLYELSKERALDRRLSQTCKDAVDNFMETYPDKATTVAAFDLFEPSPDERLPEYCLLLQQSNTEFARLCEAQQVTQEKLQSALVTRSRTIKRRVSRTHVQRSPVQ